MKITRFLAERSGQVIGSNGRGGSGTCVELEDGSIALLTARHVVIECLRNTGQIKICAFERPLVDPLEIRIDSSPSGDVALLLFSETVRPSNYIGFSDWTLSRQDIQPGQRVFACGFPGAFRSSGNGLFRSKFLLLADEILETHQSQIVSGIYEPLEVVPKTLAGFSGGGLFLEEGQFLGVITEERRRPGSERGELVTLKPNEFKELYSPPSVPFHLGSSPYIREQQVISMEIKNPTTGGVLATIRAFVEWISPSAGERAGRVACIELDIPEIETHYPINLNSDFHSSGSSDDEADRAMLDELRFLLMRIGFLLAEDNQTLFVAGIR